MPVRQHPAAFPPPAYSARRPPRTPRTAPDRTGKRAQAPAQPPHRRARCILRTGVHKNAILRNITGHLSAFLAYFAYCPGEVSTFKAPEAVFVDTCPAGATDPVTIIRHLRLNRGPYRHQPYGLLAKIE